MLLDSELVPQTVVRPNSFVGLMALYESNYLRLLRLIPAIDRIDGCFQSRVAGDCDLFVEVIENSRYTVTLSLTYRLATDEGLLADPDMTVRVYLDGKQAEVGHGRPCPPNREERHESKEGTDRHPLDHRAVAGRQWG